MMRTMIHPSFRRILNLRMHNNPRNYRRSRVNQRHSNREATIAHVNGRFTIDLIFARLSTKFFVEKSRGPLLQPEVRAVQVTILIHAAHSRSSHARHYITPQLSTGSRSPFRLRQFYRLKMLFDSDTTKCFNKDITEYLDKYQNKSINKYKAKLTNKHENMRIDKHNTRTSRSSYFNRYLRCSPTTTPTPSSWCPNTASTPLPHRPNTAATCSHAGATLPQRRPRTFLTQPSRHPRRARPDARSSHAALTPAERLLHAAIAPPSRSCTQPSRRCMQPSHRPHAALTPLHAAAPCPHASSARRRVARPRLPRPRPPHLEHQLRGGGGVVVQRPGGWDGGRPTPPDGGRSEPRRIGTV